MHKRIIAIGLGMAMTLMACGGAEETAPTSAPSTDAPSTTNATASSSAESTTNPTEAPGTTSSGSDAAASPMPGTFGAALLSEATPENAESGRFEAVMTMTPDPTSGIEDDVVFTISGAFAANGDTEFNMDFGNLMALSMAEGDEIPEEFADAFDEPMQMRTVGDTAYVKWGFFGMFFGTDKWIETEAANSEDVTSGFGFGTDGENPLEFIQALADANADVENLGTEEVRGVLTTHYRAVLDIEALAADLPADEREELLSEVGEVDIDEFPIDVWIGEDGNIYRYSVQLDAEAAAGTDEGQFISVSMVFEMWDYGADVVIEAPPADEVATEDELGFSFGG